jgi:molecular chaperone GrpE
MTDEKTPEENTMDVDVTETDAPETVVEPEVILSPEEQLQKEIEDLQAEVAEEKDKALRAKAELENFRRRNQQEVNTFKKYASEKVLLEFIPILDSFTLACEHADKEKGEQIIEGFVLIQKQLASAVEKLNVTPIDALNEAFDPSIHQAISQEKIEGKESGFVIKEVQKGYKLYDRVIRPSLVIVSE